MNISIEISLYTWQVYNGSNHANNGRSTVSMVWHGKYGMVCYGKYGMVSMVSI